MSNRLNQEREARLQPKRLEAEKPGITQILIEDGHLVYKPTHYEMHQIISEYSNKIKNIKQ